MSGVLCFYYQMKRTLLLTFAAVAVAAAAQTTPNRAFANVTGAASWTDIEQSPYGVYELPLSGGNQLSMATHNVVPANFGAVYADGRYFVSNGFAYGEMVFVTNYLYDATSWQKISDFDGEHYNIADMAWDELTGRVFGYFTHLVSQDSFFGEINLNTGRITEISRPETALSALGCHADGTLYGISPSGMLYRIDKTSGVLSPIGDTGCKSTYATSGAVLSRENRFYYATCSDSETAFYSIDLATAAATKLYDMPDGEEIRGLYFTGPSAVDGAPGEITDLAVSFTDDALAGTYSFTLPPVLFDGSAPTGEVAYQMFLDKAEVTSGTGAYGAAVSGPLSVAEAGSHTIEVVTRNDAGRGPVASLSAWIGDDVPSAVGNLTIEYEGDGRFRLEWEPSVALHGGYFVDPDVTYTVTRFPDETVTSGITDTSFYDEVPLPAENEYAPYYYMVVANYHGVKSSSVFSKSYTVGSVSPPFRETFDNRWDLGKFTILDGNSDWNRWNWVSKSVALESGAAAADDYLVLPPLLLDAAHRYSFSVDAKSKYASDTERFEVLIGEMPEVDSFTATVMEPVDVRSTEFTTYSSEFAVERDGTYFIAIHGISAPYQGVLTLDNIAVISTGLSSVDLPVTDHTDASALPASYEIYDLRGMKVADGSSPSLSPSLPAGLYLLRTPEGPRKLLVR